MEITIYSTSVCAACETLTRWLDKNNIKYNKKITDEDPKIMEEFMAVNDGMISVPFSIVENENHKVTKLVGFDQKKFKQVIGI